MIKKILIFCVGLIFLGLIGIVIYGWQLSDQIEKRFSARKWSIPSQVLSDTLLLFPGQQLNRELFQKKLKRTGYQEVSGTPANKGHMRIGPRTFDIFLNDLETPWKRRTGFPVKIEFAQNTITSITRRDTGASLPLVEIEPEEIMLFFGLERERRQLVSIDQIPEHVIHAVLAAEDSRFFQHWGIDPYAILRAVAANLRHGGIRQGGSTITQQLAKNYFLTPDRTLKRKFQEAVLALTMELMYSKDDILEIYLNEIYLGQKGSVAINGIGEAAYFYFGKSVGALSVAEAATIAGLIKGPNHYSPYVNKEACRIRRNFVLTAMQRKGWLSAEALQTQMAAAVQPVGYTVYGKKAPYFIDYLTRQLRELYKPGDLSTLGLKIYTTLDTQVQLAAETALATGLQRLEDLHPQLKRPSVDRSLQGAVIVMQPKTGHILAMVGGRNYGESQFNRITQARRQPGSAFKPFVYAAGLDTFTPISMLSNKPREYVVNGDPWIPQNFESDSKDRVTVRQAIENSYNAATVDLAMQIGLEKIIGYAAQFGFTTPLRPYPSLALGAFEVIPLELARAYCVFAAGGIMPFISSLKAVSDENGNLLQQRNVRIERLISTEKAFVMNSLLRGVVERGTGRSLRGRGIDWPVAGKTGTTNDYRDAWFIGYTPDILALVWVGFDNGDSIGFTGARAALPIWAELMRSVPHYVSGNDFRVPDGIVKKMICNDDDRAYVSKNCREPYEEYFLAENAPSQKSTEKRSAGGILDQLVEGIRNIFKGN